MGTATDLVFDDCIPEVVREIARGDHILFLLLIPDRTGASRQDLQFVPDPLEGSEAWLARRALPNGRKARTHTSHSFVWIRWHPLQRPHPL